MICCGQVRQDWGIRESVGPDRWQAIMRQYLRQDRQEAARLAAVTAGAGVATPSGRRKQAEPCAEGDSHHGTCQLASLGWFAQVMCGSKAGMQIG